MEAAFDLWGAYYWGWLIEIMIGINNYSHTFLQDVIINPCPNTSLAAGLWGMYK